MKIDNLGERAGRAVRESIAHIIFAAIVLLMVFLSFVSVRTELGTFNWSSFVINMALQLSIFIPYRWRQKVTSGKAKPYSDNKREYSNAVRDIHTHNRLSDFAKFCEEKTRELRRTKQLEIVHAAGIDTALWDRIIAQTPDVELAKDMDKLTEAQKKAIAAAHKVKVTPINPMCITSDSVNVRGYGLSFSDTKEDVRGMLFKIVPMFLWAAILTFIVLDTLNANVIETIVSIIFRLVMCLLAMFSGIMSGNTFVVRKDRVILRRIDFIRLFNEWVGATDEEQNNSNEETASSESARF